MTDATESTDDETVGRTHVQRNATHVPSESSTRHVDKKRFEPKPEKRCVADNVQRATPVRDDGVLR